MKLWVPPWRVPPPHNQTIVAKYGATFCDVAYSRWRNQWFLVLPGGAEETIAEPPLWLCDAEYANAHEIKGALPPATVEKPRAKMRRSKKPQQLALFS